VSQATIWLRPWLFPPLAYWVGLANSSEFAVDESLAWNHKIPANRLSLPGPNGLQQFSIPISGGRKVQSPFAELRFCSGSEWNVQLHKTVQTLYGKSPYYELLAHEWQEVISNPSPNFLTFFEAAFAWQWKRLGFPDSIRRVQNPAQANDLRATNWAMQQPDLPVYTQVFAEKNGFQPNVSSLDILFNIGPSAFSLLRK